VNGRNRQILVDTEGRLLRAYVHAADLHDGPAGSELLNNTQSFDNHLRKILGDDAYKGVSAPKAQELGFVLSGLLYPKLLKDLCRLLNVGWWSGQFLGLISFAGSLKIMNIPHNLRLRSLFFAI
jgi:hypothetical protein